MAKRESLGYYVLDVFSGESYKGNPLAVVFTDGNLLPEQYENIAREFGYSETSFIYYSGKEKALHVRSFTPSGFEVDGAGHNLLGAVSAALLKGISIFHEQQDEHFVIMKDAPIRLVVDAVQQQLPIIKMRQKPAAAGENIPADIIADALGATINGLFMQDFAPAIVQTEVAHLMVPVRDIDTLNRIKANNKLLIGLSKQYQFEGFYCFVYMGEESKYIAQTRFFNPLIGIDEDAATGTAAGPLAGILTHKKLIKTNKEYGILQGVNLNQPSVINVMVKDDGILVGGSSVITMEGNIYL